MENYHSPVGQVDNELWQGSEVGGSQANYADPDPETPQALQIDTN